MRCTKIEKTTLLIIRLLISWGGIKTIRQPVNHTQDYRDTQWAKYVLIKCFLNLPEYGFIIGHFIYVKRFKNVFSKAFLKPFLDTFKNVQNWLLVLAHRKSRHL